jgi:hypothetical protein
MPRWMRPVVAVLVAALVVAGGTGCLKTGGGSEQHGGTPGGGGNSGGNPGGGGNSLQAPGGDTSSGGVALSLPRPG